MRFHPGQKNDRELAEGDERACYPHQPRPGPDRAPVDGVCPGTYAVTALEFTVPAFNPEIVNHAATRQLASSDLLLDLVFSDPQTATLVDAIAGRGGHIPDPAVPDGEPMGLFPDGQGGFFTRERGEAILLIGPFLPEDGYEAPETIFFMVQAALFGQFSNDCSTFEGRLDDAFADRDGYTIPGSHDTDTNACQTKAGPRSWALGRVRLIDPKRPVPGHSQSARQIAILPRHGNG